MASAPRGSAAALAAATALLAGAAGAARASYSSPPRAPRCAHRASFTQGAGARPQRSCTTHHRRRRHRGARAACHGTRLRPAAANIAAVRSAVFCLVNRERARHGEAPLRPNLRLRRAAQEHSQSMLLDGYFEHAGPDGATPLARMRAVGYISARTRSYEVGENIAWGSLWLSTPRAIVAAWMASPGHRANILDARFRDAAIGVVPTLPASLAHGQQGAIYTQDFGERSGR